MTNGVADQVGTDAPGADGPGEFAASRAPKPPALNRALSESVRPPRHIAGGFRQVGEDLERRSREWVTMVRLLDQHRHHLESAETERDRLTARLDEIAPQVLEQGRSLKAMLEASKSGDISGDLAAEFDRSMAGLNELERTATALSANFLWCRSAWEQYARSVIRAQQMREDRK